MSRSRISFWPIVTIVIAAMVVIIALPQEWKGWVPDAAPFGFMRNAGLHLGLDLVGGTQLDFRISEEEIHTQEDKVKQELQTLKDQNGDSEEIARLETELRSIKTQESSLIEAIRTVIERRINGLGVSEATITPSFVGNEKHLLVECPGVVNTQECINVVGKTIQLEFKEEFTEVTDEFRKGVIAKADATYRAITQSGSSVQKAGQDLSDSLGVSFQEKLVLFQDTLPKGLENLWTMPAGKIIKQEGSVKVSGQDEQGAPKEEDIPGVFIAQILSPQTETGRTVVEADKAFEILGKTESGVTSLVHLSMQLDDKVPALITSTIQEMKQGEMKPVVLPDGSAHVLFLRLLVKGGEQVEASHILVAYKGASEAEPTVTRTKEEALAKAKQLKAELDKGADFAALAKAQSDGPSAKEGGKLGAISRGGMVPAFEEAAFGQKANQISDPIETQFGYHLVRTDSALTNKPDTASYNELVIAGIDASSRASDFISRMQSGEIKTIEKAITIRSIFFSLKPTGWKDTALNGKHFRTASVALDPVSSRAIVQIVFDAEGGKLFQELTKNNIDKRIAIFVGGQLVSAPTVQNEISGGSAVITGSRNIDEAKKLAQDLNTGAIPAPIHLVGQNTIEATLGAVALQTSLLAALLGTIVLMIYMIIVYKLLGVVADIALSIYAILLFALLKLPLLLLSHSYVVLTLAGMAGIILSIGMAVDANVLVFERMKEELRKGKMVKSAVESSFKYAWPAIRDSNVSTIITCAILFTIGTSIVRGFAVTLGMGVFLSLFTAITITRWILRRVAESPLAQRPELFGGKKNSEQVTNDE